MAERHEMEGRLKVETEERGAVTIVTPAGTVDLHSSPLLRKVLQRAVRSRRRGLRLVVDLAGVDYMDSSGLATLIEALQLLEDRQGLMRLAAPSQNICFVIELARLDTLFRIDETLEDALKHLGDASP